MIFIVRDDHDRGRDERIAKHVMGLAMGGKGTEEQVQAEIPVEKMKRYISYCRQCVLHEHALNSKTTNICQKMCAAAFSRSG
jgi:DNA replicative helicase MCM subunit Mcm2 (Cdc46/Mcm family)